MLDFLIKLTAADPEERYIGKEFCRIGKEAKSLNLKKKAIKEINKKLEGRIENDSDKGPGKKSDRRN